MKDKEFRALVKLLDDDDPVVATHVESQLLSMGESVIPRLEVQWEETGNEVIQSRIEDMIQLIQSRKTIEELKGWRQNGGEDLLEGWQLVSRLHFPGLELLPIKHEINRIVNRTWLELRDSMSPAEKLAVLNRMLFTKEKYRANAKDPENPENLFLPSFIERKKGSPISLGMLYMIICEKLDLKVNGLILPGYFALHYSDGKSEFYIDVFNKGAFFVRKDLEKFLGKLNLQEDPKYFSPSSKVFVLLELIRNLIGFYLRKKQRDKAEIFMKLIEELDIRE
jgi:regulator of sirC expression with transglutaminase-like and TPR domain